MWALGLASFLYSLRTEEHGGSQDQGQVLIGQKERPRPGEKGPVHVYQRGAISTRAIPGGPCPIHMLSLPQTPLLSVP